MNILRDYTFTWWQVGIFKAALLLIGVAIGAHWHELFGSYAVAFAVIGFALGAYIGSISWLSK